jgi:ribonuclease HI
VTLYANTDGASRGNPGESGIGIICRDNEGNVVFSGGGYIGTATNNVAEYEALIACLRRAQALPCTKLVLSSDSELMVRQIRGQYRVKDKNLQRYYQLVKQLLASAPFRFEIVHIEREKNHEADQLANAGIDSKQELVW